MFLPVRPSQVAGEKSKNLLIPGRFSFKIIGEIIFEEVILVNRPLFFTPLKS
jgi:hypothetical protein